MPRFLIAIPVAALLASCGSSESASFIPATTEPTVAASAASTSATTSAQEVTLGGAVISGELGVEPKVSMDTSTAAATELEIKDISQGSGAVVTADSTVTAHYVGYGAATGMKFDASWSRGEPATFPLSGVIVGWQEGLQGMKVGGRRALLIPADKGYADTPPPGSGIEAGETLLFVVDLVEVQ